MLIHLPLSSVIANPPHPCNPCLPSALGFRPSNFSSHAPRFEHVLALGRGPLDSGQVRLGWVTGLRERTKMSNVTSHRITGIRAICYIPGVPTYHPAPSKPCSGLQARLRGIPGLLPTPASATALILIVGRLSDAIPLGLDAFQSAECPNSSAGILPAYPAPPPPASHRQSPITPHPSHP